MEVVLYTIASAIIIILLALWVKAQMKINELQVQNDECLFEQRSQGQHVPKKTDYAKINVYRNEPKSHNLENDYYWRIDAKKPFNNDQTTLLLTQSEFAKLRARAVREIGD